MAVQQFMLDYPSNLNAAFVKQHAEGKGMDSAQKMNIRYKIGKLLLTNQYPHLVDRLKHKAAAQHATDMNTWNLALEDTSMAEDASQYVLPPISKLHLIASLIGLAIPSSMLYTLSFKQSAVMWAAMFL